MRHHIVVVSFFALFAAVLPVFPTAAESDPADCPGDSFTEQARVFEILTLCATDSVDSAKLMHAANVAAEWLDNDNDGLLDEPRLAQAMAETNPFLIMTPSEPDDALFDAIEPALETRFGQDLAADETDPGHGDRDASQEEIHHLIMQAGWMTAFPDVFKSKPGSDLYGQWVRAENAGHYSYDDPTCDAECKVVEFFYLATAAYLGSQADLFSDELRLKSRKELKDALPDVVAIMEEQQYNYPINHWPTGQYAHSENIVFNP